ncbi:unnamed protein product [Mytilus edulis]|uniref:Tesmin/TSO1-like CXC domain-containing protein n=1 Tax=Mytilus edulis TaxID=6550 RepID=A0A8S3SP42_MYTED|nr:unnamed protein product [Mytilus edulis]
MSGRSSCSKLHPERRPGPCAYCNNDHISNRYIHLIQKASDLPDFTNFVSSSYKLSDLDCICRKCEDSEGCSSSDIHHYTEINVPVFEKAFSVSIQTEFPEYSTSDTFFSHLCHSHYNKLNKCINLNVVQCIVCDKFSGKNTGSFKTVSEDKRELFTRYFNFDMHLENLICCPYCYNNFNSFSRSDAAEDQLSKTTEYLFSCLENFTIIDTEKVTTENIDLFSFRSVLESVINSFVEEKALLLPNLFEKYKCILHKNANKLGLCVEQKVFHRPQWLFTMLKSCLGRALSYYVPKKKNLGRMIYRNGTDIFGCLHALVVENCKCIEDNKRLKKESIIQAEKLASTVSEENRKNKQEQSLEDAVKILKNYVKIYVSDKIKMDGLPDIDNFNCKDEILKIPPILWNFIFRICSTDNEEKVLKKSQFNWNLHYSEPLFNIFRMMPRLYILSCIFHLQNSQCVQPLHLLCTDIADKFSNSSSTFLSINARLGAGISKDSLRRYITNRCRELEKKQRYIFSDSFIVASFDNLDKNQAYSVVCAGKDRSGFHGTTIQTVVPKPSQKMNMFDDSNLISNLNHVNQTSIEHDISEVPNSRDRKLEKGIIQKLVNPDDKFGLPQVKKQNKFSDMSPSDLKETAAEISEWDEFYRSVTKYGFSKNFFKKENIVLPGIKTFFSIPVESTEKSDFSSVAILDETADSKDTVLKVLNILYDKFQVGQLTNYVIVVGDGKSYDHLIKLKSEYGEQMDWVLAYPGDWHILKNVLPIFVKIYFDAGLRQLATKHHHGATLKVLTECSKFAVTHRFFIQAWEAVMRHQVKSFFEYKSCESPYDIQISDLILNIISDMSLDEEEDEVCKTDVWEKRLIPYHLADLHTFPEPVIQHFTAGCFSVSISGKHLYSVALDEAHEMEINLKSKNALNSFSQSSLANLTFYLPYRAKTLHNLKSELQLEREEGLYQREGTMSYVKNAEKTVCEYMSNLETSSLFDINCNEHLHHIFTRTETDHEQTDSLINYRKYGEEDMANYLKCFLFRTYETAGKPPSRKRRNLKTFAPIKITIHKQKKEIKDQNTVPKAPVSSKTTVIIDGMFIINTSPLASHQTFGDYGDFLFNRWIIKYYNQYTANEVHLLFDDPNRNGVSPKDIERTRRNTVVQEPVVRTCISSDTPLLSNWRNFIAVRHQKRLLVNFLSEYFLSLSLTYFSTNQCCFVTAGGFDDDRKDRAISILKGQVVDYDLASGNHEEADTRVWLHASVTTADQVIIYSPDTDVFFIGLPLVSDLNKTVYVQLRDSPYNNSFLSMDKLVKCITLNDSLLQGIDSVLICMQLLFIYSGCDFVSYFRGCGKKTFFDVFRKHASFIVGNGSFSDVHGHNGLYSFYRLICSVYFSKHRAAFQPYSTPKSLFDSISEGDLHEKHISFISAIREKLWERVVTEVEMMPNHEALKLHWMRCCWVFDYWSQSTSNTHALSDLSKCGWQITDNRLEIVWDTVLNFQKVEKTVEWYTKGCGCKTGCKTNRCKCRKAQNENCDGFCGPGCKCVNCFNVPDSGDQVLDMSIDLDDVISDDPEEFEDPVEVEQPELDGLVEQLDQTDDYWLFSTEEI